MLLLSDLKDPIFGHHNSAGEEERKKCRCRVVPDFPVQGHILWLHRLAASVSMSLV